MLMLDWIVIIAYFLVVLAIGWYYSRGNKSAVEFVLGGRSINPITAGLSLFATLASTLSYLAVPGETIGYGPMFLSQICAYPIIIIVVGWGLIPFLMRQPVTSAYELLEKRLGGNIRLAGAVIFVLLRVGWMATIFYATSHEVIIPLLGVSERHVPLICLVMGLVTMVYSSSGGIKAVILTDAMQAILMLLGALATIVVVSMRLGGPMAWIPEEWPAHWPESHWGFAPHERMSFLTVLMSTVVWYVCTNGSDQMSIQRFLSTRDAPAARRTLMTSLATETIVTLLLAGTGVALLTYYQHFASELGPEITAAKHGDRFFTHFVTAGMPFGLSGLVIAAILAAAMSSLSSGMNSTSAVLENDVLGRLVSQPLAPEKSVQRMKWLTWGVGLAAVCLSIGNLWIQGNLLERCYKIVNLLTAPLFVLFFMAMFVRRASAAAAWCGLIASAGVAIAIAYIKQLEVSIFWMMPASLLAGVSVGYIASWVVGADSPLDSEPTNSTATE